MNHTRYIPPIEKLLVRSRGWDVGRVADLTPIAIHRDRDAASRETPTLKTIDRHTTEVYNKGNHH